MIEPFSKRSIIIKNVINLENQKAWNWSSIKRLASVGGQGIWR